MFEGLRQRWRALKDAKPGARFQDFHRHRHQSRRSALQKPLVVTVGILIVIAGTILLFTPGPGLLLVVIGAGLLAQESLLAARAMDWLEVKARKSADGSIRAWMRFSLAMKGFIIFLALLGIVAAGWGAYELWLNS